MKDLFKTLFIVIMAMGFIAAAPIFGLVVGVGLGIYFLHHIISEDNQNAD